MEYLPTDSQTPRVADSLITDKLDQEEECKCDPILEEAERKGIRMYRVESVCTHCKREIHDVLNRDEEYDAYWHTTKKSKVQSGYAEIYWHGICSIEDSEGTVFAIDHKPMDAFTYMAYKRSKKHD